MSGTGFFCNVSQLIIPNSAAALLWCSMRCAGGHIRASSFDLREHILLVIFFGPSPQPSSILHYRVYRKKESLPSMVRLSLPTFLALLSTTTLASSSDASPKRHSISLVKRQTGAFVPSTSDGHGQTCAEAFGPGFVSCGTGSECVNPAKGETCCSGGCMFSHLSV